MNGKPTATSELGPPHRAGSSAGGSGWLALVLLIGLAGCGADQRPSPSVEQSEPAGPALGPPLPTRPQARVAISVVDVVQLPASETEGRVFAIHLRGGAGTSAIRRSLEIRAWMDPVAGSSCGRPPLPSVLSAAHPDAVQPNLEDQTRTVVLRSRGDQPEPGTGQSSARFRYGPVPSLNGDFEGWVSFEFPATDDDGFCAFDLRGEVVLVAGVTESAALPTVRVDSRDRLDGSFDH